MDNLLEYLRNPRRIAGTLWRHVARFMGDEQLVRLKYRLETGRRLDLADPRRFTEKIQYLKLWYRKPEFTALVDKIAAKKYVETRLGKHLLIPTLKVWNSPEEIAPDDLPDQFVLKTTHGGGSNGVIVCKDKSTFDFAEARKRLDRAMKADIYMYQREWPYKNVRRRILAEPYMQNEDDAELTDYKFYCFDGVPRYCQVIANRHTGETIDFFDMEWNHQEFVGLNPACGNSPTPIRKPTRLEEMYRTAFALSEGLPFLRVDLYEINGKVYFGEMTFYPASGMGAFSPDEWDFRLGDLITLPKDV